MLAEVLNFQGAKPILGMGSLSKVLFLGGVKLDYIDIIEKSIYNIDLKICGIIDDYKVLQDSQKVADYAGLKLKNKLSS